jgi:hypothetical protein
MKCLFKKQCFGGNIPAKGQTLSIQFEEEKRKLY